jgi:hypothetical protein
MRGGSEVVAVRLLRKLLLLKFNDNPLGWSDDFKKGRYQKG